MAEHRRRFKIVLPLSDTPHAPVPHTPAPKVIVQTERRHILTARSDGLISWHDFENARLEKVIRQKVMAEKTNSKKT